VEGHYPDGIPWLNVRMLTIDDLSVSFLLRGDEIPKHYTFKTVEEKNRVLKAWFGVGWTDRQLPPCCQ
jgi:hypothetical protein